MFFGRERPKHRISVSNMKNGRQVGKVSKTQKQVGTVLARNEKEQKKRGVKSGKNPERAPPVETFEEFWSRFRVLQNSCDQEARQNEKQVDAQPAVARQSYKAASQARKANEIIRPKKAVVENDGQDCNSAERIKLRHFWSQKVLRMFHLAGGQELSELEIIGCGGPYSE